MCRDCLNTLICQKIRFTSTTRDDYENNNVDDDGGLGGEVMVAMWQGELRHKYEYHSKTNMDIVRTEI